MIGRLMNNVLLIFRLLFKLLTFLRLNWIAKFLRLLLFSALLLPAFIRIGWFYVTDGRIKRGIKWEQLRDYSTEDYFHSLGAYNYLIKAIKDWDGKSKFNGQKADLTEAIISNISRKNPELDSLVQKLRINFLFKTASYFYNSDNWVKKDEYLVRIYAAYDNDTTLNEEKSLRLAKFFIEFKNSELARMILQPHAESSNKETLILLAKLNYYNSIEYKNERYANSLVELFPKLLPEDWCGMFVGNCNISFQVFDSENLRKFYCDKCSRYKNIAQTPEKW